MSEFAGEKTEQPTPRKLEDAQKKGQVARSADVQTAIVLLTALGALTFTGKETWALMAGSLAGVLGHLHEISLAETSLQGHAIYGAFVFVKCAGPVVLAILIGGLLAGGLQNGFSTSSEALTPDWNRLSPVSGFKKIFSTRSAVSTGLGILKLTFIILCCYTTIQAILGDPIFTTAISVGQVAGFLAGSSFKIVARVLMVLAILAAADYAYQFWQTNRDLMMTKEEIKDEMKNSEGDPQMKARRRKVRAMSKKKMLAAVAKADVVVTNPTHIAIAIRYDAKTMKAPRIVAKGIRLNAARIREMAERHKVPLVENKPLARLMFKYGKVGGEIPAQLYSAVAEILAWVYRMNRYRYYAEANSLGQTE